MGVKVGEKCSIYERVTIRQRYGKVSRIGNNVVIYRGAVIIGDVSTGDNAVINENPVVICSPFWHCCWGLLQALFKLESE